MKVFMYTVPIVGTTVANKPRAMEAMDAIEQIENKRTSPCQVPIFKQQMFSEPSPTTTVREGSSLLTCVMNVHEFNNPHANFSDATSGIVALLPEYTSYHVLFAANIRHTMCYFMHICSTMRMFIHIPDRQKNSNE